MLNQLERLQEQPLPISCSAVRKIAIFRALHLGDIILAVPAMRAIRTQFPHAEITLIGLEWAASFAQRFSHYIDRFVIFGGYPGIDEVEVVPARTAHFLEQQRAYRYDLVIQMHGSGETSNPCVHAFGGRITVGYYTGTSSAELTLGTEYPDSWPEVLRNLGLAKLVGCRTPDPTLEFPLFPMDHREASRLLAVLAALPHANRPWIGIHAGAHSPTRRWPARYFAKVADEFARRWNAQIILTGGSDEIATVQAVEEYMETRPLRVDGKTSIGGLAALISELDLFISNDTGPAHLANAVDTPSITIFGPIDPQRWTSLDAARHPIVRRPVDCSPCTFWECPIDHRCLQRLSPEMVMQVAEKLVKKGIVECNV